MLYPHNNMNQATNLDITGPPGDYPRMVNHEVAGFNQQMMKLAEVFDPFIQQSLIAHPSYWYNAIPRGAFPNFNGYIHETRVFRGGLQHYAGLYQFSDIDPVSSATNNPCVKGQYETPGYAWERFQWSGKQAYWGSDPVCVDSLKYIQQAQQQLAWILQVGADYGRSMMEVWNRDYLIKTATVDADRGYIMTSSYVGSVDAPRFYYDPFVTFGVGEDVEPSTGITKPFIVFKADQEVEPLNFDVLEFLHQDLEVSAPSGGVGSQGGSPIYGLPISKFDFEQYIKGNEYELTNWREARAEQLITGVSGVRTHRDWALSFDGNQLRFKIRKVVANYDSQDFGGVGAALDGETVIIAEFVPPRIEGRVGEDSRRIPEWNPEYASAELAVAPIHLNNVFTNLMGTEVTSLGSGTFFGPQPGLNGKWSWLNIIDRLTNPYGKIGNFAGAYEIFPRPEPHIVFSTAFLYRRCTQPLRSRCPIDNPNVNLDIGEGTDADVVTSIVSNPDAAGNSFIVDLALAKTLPDTPIGTPVILTFDGLLAAGTSEPAPLELPGVLIKTSGAPRYTVFTNGTIRLPVADSVDSYDPVLVVVDGGLVHAEGYASTGGSGSGSGSGSGGGLISASVTALTLSKISLV